MPKNIYVVVFIAHIRNMLTEHTSKEFSILTYIDQNSDATQRQLSEHVGVSLGTINILVKRLVKKGLLKIERMQPNSIRYFLTPSGLASKLERTYGYIVRVYRELASFRVRIASILHSFITERNKSSVWFFGPKDDFTCLLSEILEAEFSIPDTRILSELSDLSPIIKDKHDVLVITWDTTSDELVQSLGVKPVNILAKIAVGT